MEVKEMDGCSRWGQLEEYRIIWGLQSSESSMTSDPQLPVVQGKE